MTQQVRFERVLGRVDLVLFNVSAILTVDTLAAAASTGVSWFTWWSILLLCFFIPYGLISAELGAGWPDEGGLYVWVSEALGHRAGAMAAWLYWVNNAFWIPSVYLVFAATFAAMFLEGTSTKIETSIAIFLTWLTIGIGIVRLRVSKWIPSTAAVVKSSIFISLGCLGLARLFAGRPAANEFELSGLIPAWGDSVIFLPVLLYNTLGFELASSAGDEMKNPRLDVPRAVLLAGIVISFLYGMATLGILLSVPLADLNLVTGTWDALKVLGQQWGTASELVVLLLGIGFLYACIGNIVTWSLGTNRVAAAAAEAGTLPHFLGKLHPKYQTPYMAFLALGVVSTLLMLGNATLSRGSSQLFWLTFRLSGICFLLSYLLMFPAFLVLRYRQPDRPRSYRAPGGTIAAWAATVLCTFFIGAGTVLFFVPSSSVENGLQESLLLLAQTVLTVVVGWWLIPSSGVAPVPSAKKAD
jgi:amino acid transporter